MALSQLPLYDYCKQVSMKPQNTAIVIRSKAVGYSKVDPLPVFAGDSTTEEPNTNAEEMLPA